MENPPQLRYTLSHVWLAVSDHGCTVGITEFAQDQLGDLVYVGLPQPGQHYSAGQDCVLLESVKSASDVAMPASGTVLSINEQLADQPELINQQPFADGWLFSFEPDDVEDLQRLLSAADYETALDA